LLNEDRESFETASERTLNFHIKWGTTTAVTRAGFLTRLFRRVQELGALGYKFIFITLFASHAATYAVWNALEELARDEEQVGHPTESHH